MRYELSGGMSKDEVPMDAVEQARYDTAEMLALEHIAEYLDPLTGEINCTQLAEWVASELEKEISDESWPEIYYEAADNASLVYGREMMMVEEA